MIITGQGNFLGLADGLLDNTSETKNGFKHFTAKSGNLSDKFCNTLQFFKLSDFFLFDLFTIKARKLKVAVESS